MCDRIAEAQGGGKQNLQTFSQALGMFSPFVEKNQPQRETTNNNIGQQYIDELRNQLTDMQKKLDSLVGKAS